MIIGSFGASAVLIYGAIRRPLSQARNLIEGHVSPHLSCFPGIYGWPLTGCSSQKIHTLGDWYTLIPGRIGPVILFVVALLITNSPKDRRYPEFWI